MACFYSLTIRIHHLGFFPRGQITRIKLRNIYLTHSGIFTNNWCTTKWAVLMRPQPGIYTTKMKSMATLGQKPNALIFFELTQANRALCPFYQPIIFLILTGCNGVNHRLRQTDGVDVPYVVINHRPMIFIDKVLLGIEQNGLIPLPGVVSPRKVSLHNHEDNRKKKNTTNHTTRDKHTFPNCVTMN
ncbi:hypothetical protein PanWU01x14_289590 [Parasponia andersonii]|uniref:Uncharacterized protein n=1 Tax=Parasponia andersonii TaxID=3476 RepID=A0A2P5AY53_PARAD|nr:hypothetical protein PanWU01x14_289590 [Parasponia andersonii]